MKPDAELHHDGGGEKLGWRALCWLSCGRLDNARTAESALRERRPQLLREPLPGEVSGPLHLHPISEEVVTVAGKRGRAGPSSE